MPKFRTVTGRWVAKTPDGRDADIHPDGVPLWGHVRFEPIYKRGMLAYPGGFVEPQTIPARLIDGDLAVEVLVEDPDNPEDDQYTTQPVSLLVSEDPNATQTWTYRLHFDRVTIGEDGPEIDLPTHVFSLPPGEEPLDLATTIGVVSGGTITVQGPPGAAVVGVEQQDREIRFVLEDGTHTAPVQLPVGPAGPANHLRIGTVTEGEVAATLDGDAPEQTLSLTLPRGAKGDQGDEGPYGGTEVTDPQVASYVTTETATKTALDQSYIRGINATAYGAVGDGAADDTASIQAAIDAASTFGLAATISDGRYRLTGAVSIPTGADIRLAPGAVLDISEVPAGVPALSVMGTSGTAIPLTADAAEHDNSIIVADASGISAGDWIKVSSALMYGDTDQPIGEIQRVASVDGSTVTLEDGLHSAYLTADSADILPISFRENVTISGGHMVGDPETPLLHRGVVLDMARNVSVSGMSFQWVHYVGVWVLDSVDISILGCSFDEALAAGLGYGIMGTWAVQDMSVSACHGMKVRHLVTLGGGATRRGIVRRVTVTGCTASQCFDAALDAHPGAEDVSFVGNTVTGSRQDGIVAQGGRFVISGNTVTGSARHGIFVQVRTLGGLGGTVAGNTIHGSDGTGVQISFRPGAEYRVWNGLTVTGNAITDSGTHGVQLNNADATFQVEAIAVTGNTVRRSTRHGIHLRGAKDCAVGSNHVGKTGEEAIMLQTCPDSTLTGNSVADAGLRAFRLVASPGVTVSANRGTGAAIGLLTDAASAPVVAMGNNFSDCTTRMSLAGTGNISTTADASGAYNL